MLANLQLVTIGAAAVVVLALFAGLLDRRNRRGTMLWVLILTAGAGLWYVGSFVHQLATAPEGPWLHGVHVLAMTTMALGLLVMPSALLHGAGRLLQTGLAAAPPRRAAFGLCYLPVVATILIAFHIRDQPDGEFFIVLSDFVIPYVAWMALSNLLAVLGFLYSRRCIAEPRVRQFLGWLAGLLVVMTCATVVGLLDLVHRWPGAGPGLQLFVSLLPVIPAVLFGFFVLRFQFVPLVLERTLLYGTIVVVLILLHAIYIPDLTTELTDRYRLNFAVIEVVLGVVLVVAYQPFQQRATEALRYLLGARVAETRDRLRQLAVTMTELSGRPAAEILTTFTSELARALGVDRVNGWLFDGTGAVNVRTGDSAQLTDVEAGALEARLAAENLEICSLHEAPDRESFETLYRAGVSVAVRLHQPPVCGLVVIGGTPWHRGLGAEERNSLVMLTRQLAATIDTSRLRAERLSAERRASLNEKLSTLGLLAGSIAHEVRNPLSSIKTMITVLSEQLAGDSRFTDDFRLILGEIDRLTLATSQLLEFARPAATGAADGSMTGVLGRTLRIMRHLARQKAVTLDAELPVELPPVQADENSLREIFFNLLANALDAVPTGGRIVVTANEENGFVATVVADNGPGIPPDVKARMFEPFVTTKLAGTGLGLHIVSRRVRELGGDIRCETAPDKGTSFIVRLPCQNSES